MASVEITSSWTQLGLVALSAAGMLAGIILYVRIVGLRSFSKMSSFDFAVTVAMGSLLASISLSGSSLAEGLVAAAALLLAQTAIALGRSRAGLGSVVDNRALLLMAGPEILEDHMRKARITVPDLHAKLRAANIHNYDEVRYVVLETTGDVSVVHGDGVLDPQVFADVEGAERLRT